MLFPYADPTQFYTRLSDMSITLTAVPVQNAAAPISDMRVKVESSRTKVYSVFR